MSFKDVGGGAAGAGAGAGVKPNDKNFFMAFQAAAGAVKCEEMLLLDDESTEKNTTDVSGINTYNLSRASSKRNLMSDFEDVCATSNYM